MDYRHHSRPPNQYDDDDDAVATESDPLLLLPSCRGPKFVSPVRYDDVLEMEGGGGDRNNVDVAVVVHHDNRCLAITPPSGSSSQPSPHLYHYLRRIAALLVFVVLLVLVVLLLHDVATVTTIVVVRPQRVQIPFHRGIGSFFSAPALTFSVHKPSGVVTRQGDRHDDGSSSSISSLSAGAGAEARGCCIHRQAPSPHEQIPVDDNDDDEDDDDEIYCLELNRNLLLVQERTRRSHTASSTRPRARPATAAATPKVRPAVVPLSSSLAPSARSNINSISAPGRYTKIGAVQTYPGMGPFFYYWFRRNVYEPILLKERRRGNDDDSGGGLLAFALRPQRDDPDILWVYQTFTSEGYYLNVHTPLLYTEDIVRTLVKLLLPDRAPLDLELRPALYTKGFDDPPPPAAAARNASIAGGLRQTPKALSPVDAAGHGTDTDGTDAAGTDDTTTSPPSGDAADHPLGATVSIPPPLPLPLPPAGRASSTSSSAFDDGPPLPPLPFPEPHPPHGPKTDRHGRSGRSSSDDGGSDSDDGDSSYYTVLLYAETKPGQGHAFAAWFHTHVCETVVAHDGSVLSYAVHQEANTDDDHLWIIQTHRTERDFVRHTKDVYPRCCCSGGEKRHGGCRRQSGTRGSSSGNNNQTIAAGMQSYLLGKVQYVALSPTSMVIGMNP